MMTNFNTRTMTILTEIAELNRPFYASELGHEYCGGSISALARNGYIKQTGKSKQTFVNLYGDIYKACTVYEWEISRKNVKRRISELEDLVRKAMELANVLENL